MIYAAAVLVVAAFCALDHWFRGVADRADEYDRSIAGGTPPWAE